MWGPEFRRWLQEPSKGSWAVLAIALAVSAVLVILTLAGC